MLAWFPHCQDVLDYRWLQAHEHKGWSITEAYRGSSVLVCRHVAHILIIQCPASCLIWYLYVTSSIKKAHLNIYTCTCVCYFLSRIKSIKTLPPAPFYAKATSTEHIPMSFQLVISSFKWTYRQYPFTVQFMATPIISLFPPYQLINWYERVFSLPGKDIFKCHLYVLIVLK